MAESYQLKAILSAVDKMSPVFKQIGSNAKASRKYMVDLANAASGLSGKIGIPLAALSGLAAGFGAGAIKKAMIGFAQAGNDAYKGSIKAGMSVEQWGRLRYVFEQSGSTVESMEASMGKLNKALGMAGGGKDKMMVALFNKMNVPMRSNGQLRSAVDLLPVLADHFNATTNPAVRARMASKLFGKQWGDIAPVLALGSDGIAGLLKHMESLKGVMNDDAVKKAREWGRSLYDLDIVTKGFQGTIAKELVPVMQPLLESFSKWASENRGVIATNVKKFAEDLIDTFKKFDWDGLAAGAKQVKDSMVWLVDQIGGTQNAVIGLAVAMNIQAISAAASLAATMYRAGGAMFFTALAAVAPIAPLQALSASMLATNAAGAGMVGMLGKVAALTGVVGAAWAGWELGGLINRNLINPAVSWATGEEGQSLGGWLYDVLNKQDPSIYKTPYLPKKSNMLLQGGSFAAASGGMLNFMNVSKPMAGATTGSPSILSGPSLTGVQTKQPSTDKAGGEITVRFENAPPGMRVSNATSRADVDVGYSSIGNTYQKW
jgi:hypothetical protein